MEVAAGRSDHDPGTPAPARSGVDLALAWLVAVLLAAVVAGGVLVWQARGERAAAATEQERYGAVLAAARAEAEAFVNITHEDARASLDRVAEGATGELREQYTSASDEVVEELERERSAMQGEVLYAGVVELDQDSATVIAATTGTITSKQTGNVPVGRNFRLRLELVHEDGRWLTSDLRFVS